MDIPANVINKSLYKDIKELANSKYKRPGLYKSAWIVKEYVSRGGKYSGSKPSANTGIQRWLAKENWIQVEPYLKTGKIVQCGSTDSTQACRPLKRASKETPITIPELLKLHSKSKLLALALEKKRNPAKRVNWSAGTIS